MATAVMNGNATHAPIEVSVPLPLAPQTDINIRLHDNGPNITLFLTTTTPDAASSMPLGSLVYAMPNRITPSQPLSTPLFTHSVTLDFTTRLSKLLARRTGKPIYVSSSMSFANAGMGGTVEEEMEGFKRVVQVVLGMLHQESATAKNVEAHNIFPSKNASLGKQP